MEVRKLKDGRIVTRWHAKELLAFIRTFIELGMGEVAVKAVLDIDLGDYRITLAEKDIIRWGDKIE